MKKILNILFVVPLIFSSCNIETESECYVCYYSIIVGHENFERGQKNVLEYKVCDENEVHKYRNDGFKCEKERKRMFDW